MSPALESHRPGFFELGRLEELDPGAVARACEIPGVRRLGEVALEVPKSALCLPEVQGLCSDAVCAAHENPWVVSLPYQAQLRSYQCEAAQSLLNLGGVILSDQLGLGKTRTAAVAALSVSGNNQPVLIVGPKYLRASWYEELVRAGLLADESPGDLLGFFMCEGTKVPAAEVYPPQWIYCHYEILKYWWNWIWNMRPKALIADEAHMLKNWKSQRSRALALACSGVRHRFLLTGTPMPNRLSEMHNLLSLACGKFSWGSKNHFIRRYCGGYHDGYRWVEGKPTHVGEFKARLKSCYIRRTYEDVELELPPITREKLEVTMLPGFERRYARAMQGKLKGYSPADILSALAQNKLSHSVLEGLNKLRLIASEAKYSATKELLESALAQGEDIVCFCWTRKMCEKLGFYLHGHVVHGGLSQAVRDDTVRDWRASGRLLVATYGALGAGVNLQRARLVVLHDLDWVPATLLQAEGRVWRQGQQRPVVSKWVVARGSLDTLIAELLLSKAGAISTATGDYGPEALQEVIGDMSQVRVRFERMLTDWRSRL